MNELPVTIEYVDANTVPQRSTPSGSESHLGAIIPTARGRKVAYAIYAAVALIVGNAAVGFAAINVDQPVWLVVCSAIVANLAAPFSALAIANAKV